MQRNIEQEKAIAHINGPAILISCPGSGKTTTLLRRINNLIQHGVKSEKILMITFTKAAADEMKIKYRRNFGNEEGIMFSTIHALCLKILLTYGNMTGDCIINSSDVFFFLSNLAKNDRSINDVNNAVNAFMTQYSAAKNNLVNIAEVDPEGIPKKSFVYMAEKYEEKKRLENKIDFDDMLLKCLNLLRSNPAVLRLLQERWDYVQVDEYQDTNSLQKDIIYLLTKRHRNLCVAGDDDQSIYRFRGARPEIMLNFKEDFPDTEIFRISTNYRSYPKIIDYANRLIKNNRNRYDKQFLCGTNGEAEVKFIEIDSQKEQSSYLAEQIKKGIYSYDETAILFRTNQQAEAIADVFLKNDIPFISNEKIPDSYSTWIWNDIITYYRLSRNIGTKQDLERSIDKPSRFLGYLLRLTDDYSREGLLQAASDNLFDWKKEKAFKNIAKLFYDISALGKRQPVDFIKYLYEKIEYRKYIHGYANAINQDEGYFDMSLNIFLEDAAKFKNMDEWLTYIKRRSFSLKKKTEKGVSLSTMHRSKGLEWKNVYIIDCNSGVIPSKKSKTEAEIEEERRLFYVAITRAKENLTLLYLSQKNNNQIGESPFLLEMKAERDNQIIKKEDASIKRNDLVYHEAFGNCIVLEENGVKCRIKSLKNREEHLVLKSYLRK